MDTTKPSPRWRAFIWQGAILLVVALITATVSAPALGVAIGVLGGLLLLAGLIGAASGA